ncbi:hypothetical protein M422DRAFT_248195 [Sphaerobolus stellatus SS14]|uniref:Uncharacterized protein n=1 Tax=Sphaerobolus stellatus (strain SS14) TaxID=990650 RepID=A0A0C9W607_SPHS4|nr:hypothetical protein M422DRAFT_248195 [Sphaerobolus stellatus SS14]
MAQASLVLKDMLEITHGSTSNEGSSDEHPICLGEPFTVDKMNNLLGWFLRYKRDEQLTIEELTDILELETFLEMECAQVTAIDGISFLVPQWIKPAFLALLRADLSTITADDYIIMGPQLSTYTDWCTKLANKWSSGWKQNFVPLYLHPDIPLTPEEALHKLAFGPMPGVTPDCRNAVIQRITEMKVFEKEHEISRKADFNTSKSFIQKNWIYFAAGGDGLAALIIGTCIFSSVRRRRRPGPRNAYPSAVFATGAAGSYKQLHEPALVLRWTNTAWPGHTAALGGMQDSRVIR